MEADFTTKIHGNLMNPTKFHTSSDRFYFQSYGIAFRRGSSLKTEFDK